MIKRIQTKSGKNKAGHDDDETLRLALIEGQVKAISRSMAVIRFELDGTIVEANDNFLNALGYSSEEIVGRHHRMFVDPTYAASAEYETFWRALRAGEPQSAEFRRLGKGGREVFIQASYNPIFGADGKPFCVVKFAADVTPQRVAEREAAAKQRALLADALRVKSALTETNSGMVLADDKLDIVFANETFLKMVRTYEAAIQKDLPHFRATEVVGKSIDIFHKVPARQRQLMANLRAEHRARINLGGRVFDLVIRPAKNEAGETLGYSLEWMDMTDQIAAESEVTRVLDAAVAGDLTQRIAADRFEGFLRAIGENMNRLIDSVADSFRGVKVAVEQIGQASTQLGATSQMMSSSALQLNRAAEQSSMALVSVAEGVRSNADNAGMANQLVTQTSEAAKSGQRRMEEMSTAMSAINGSAQQIAKIIKVIDEIAFQTNLLALNAAVEAARAGRHGKGFAVVAQEVRSLAERSAKAAKETAALIEDSVAKVSDGVRLTDTTREALREIVSNVVKVVDLAGEIATASGEQARSVAAVTESMRQVTEGAQAGSQQSNEVAAAAEEMRRQMDLVKQSVEKYRVAQAASTGLPINGQIPPEFLEQLMTLWRANGGPPAAAKTNGHANGHSNGNGHDPRAMLPLDRDERGYNGF